MELDCGFPAKNQTRSKHLHGEGGISPTADNQLVIKLPDPRVFRVIARSLLLALVIITFPWLGKLVIDGLPQFNSYMTDSEANFGPELINAELLTMLFRDLTNEGVLKSEGKVLFVSHGSAGEVIVHNPRFYNDNKIYLISEFDSERQSSVPDATFDFTFASSFGSGKYLDRTLKTGGIAAIQLSNDPSDAFWKPSNYKIVYIRRYASTIVAMKKTGPSELPSGNWPNKRRLCAFPSEAKKAALDGLEDVLLEPPRKAHVESDKYLKRTKFLPDLTGDSLEGYPRRVFINVGLPERNGGSPDWFERNYPTRNWDFEIYKIETVATDELSTDTAVPQLEMSDWLRKNVKEEEYVVMKAEAEVVEELVKNKAMCLVDELFLECKHRGLGGRKNKSKRVYWECLALYGKLRDEGVAVHQWWG
ncbi:PREDICTED: uncharacterized protein LOC104609205 [Nelumbo nucifera]|uniref:Uncharacterized protein LOC104609205 n=1 Tax=Nelumbo nucifera TaxID=4432 RepID=A0A1U8AZG1_NELNU|nr:PREDICTED: uncharacterized protein LOC104609205 [Nelumbo nucifera]